MVQYPTEWEIKDPTSFIHNFDVSVILPFYKKIVDFKEVLPLNHKYFYRNGIEVIIVMDESSEKDDLITLIKEYPFINWKVVVNEVEHTWRNPTKAINVGIKNSTKNYILVCSPESIFYTDIIYHMRKMLNYYDEHFVIGTVAFTTSHQIESTDLSFDMNYGSIMVKKEYLYRIGGYDESFNNWGGDDDNIRARLEMLGIRKIICKEAKVIHKERSIEDLIKRYDKRLDYNVAVKRMIPDLYIANNNVWGMDFNNVIYDWQDNSYAEELLVKYMAQFDKVYLSPECCKKKYSVILLVQTYNASERISSFIQNMEPYFDGMIFLDDASSDDTFDLIQSTKLLVKVSNKINYFSDIINRNSLLKLASFFKSKWLCVMDDDEIFDIRFSDFGFLATEQCDTIIFRHIHLWDNNDTYNADYPLSDNGILERHRMFKNIGSSQIISDKKKLHCYPIPYIGKTFHSNILYHHLGNIYRDDRIARYRRYVINDIYKDQQSYEHLIVETPKLLHTKDIYLYMNKFYNREIMDI